MARAGGTARAGWWAAAGRYAPAGAAAAAMAVLGWWGLARGSSMGNDEVATRWAALLNLHALAHLLDNVDAVHGLYYLLMHGWVVVGSSPAVLRIPSVAAMTAAVAMTAILGRRLTGSGWAGLFAGLVMALTPIISYYAQTARSYAMVLACVAGATLVLVHALSAEAAEWGGAAGSGLAGRGAAGSGLAGDGAAGSGLAGRGAAGSGLAGGGAAAARPWLAYGALVAVAGYLNELSLLMLAAHAVTVLLARPGRAAVARWAAAGAAGALLVTPLVLISIRENRAVTWISRPGLGALRVLFGDYFGATTLVAVLLAVCAVAAVLPAAVLPAGAERDEPSRRGEPSLSSVAAPLLLVPAGLLLLESLVARPYYVDRYVLYGEAGAALLAGAGIWRIGRWLGGVSGRRELLWVPGVALCACALVLQLGPQQRARTPRSRQFDFGGPSAYVGANARPGDGVLFLGTLFRKARLGYPADFAKTSDFAMAESPERAGDFRGRDKPFASIAPLMLAHSRIWVLGAAPSARLPAGTMRSESLLLQQRFTLAGERHFRGIDVTLWLRR